MAERVGAPPYPRDAPQGASRVSDADSTEAPGEQRSECRVAIARQRYRPADRVKRRADFRLVQSRGRKVHAPHFVFAVWVRVRPGGGTAPSGGAAPSSDGPRLGITVTRKVAGSVGRNRIKRVMREVFRRNRDLFPNGCDVVAIAKNGAEDLGYADVLAQVNGARRALHRAAEGHSSDRAARSPRRGAP